MIVPENVVHNFTYPVTAISILANSALIFVILTTPNKQVGAYRFLLLSFAVVDILISIVHFVLVPSIILTEFGIIFYGFRFMGESTAIGVWSGIIFVALFYQTFVLLSFHYVYRYVLLCNPSWLRWIGQNNPWRNWITLAIIVDVLYIGGFMLAIRSGFLPNDSTRSSFHSIMKEYYNIDLLAPNLPGYLGLNYREPQPDGSYTYCIQSYFTMGLVMILFFGSGIVIIACIWKVMATMKQSKAMVATRTRNMQNQLFRTLLIQTIVPTITSYVPLGSTFIIPLTGISLGGWGTVAMMSTALFPLVDPFLVLFLVSGYRAKLPHFMRRLVASTAQVSIITPGTTLKSQTSPNERSTQLSRTKELKTSITAMIVPENIVHNFTYPVTAVSILANSALIYVILTTPNKQVGAYRYLLLSFAVVDILISIVHFVLVPAIVMTEFGFVFYGFRFMGDSTAIGVWSELIFVALFYQTFVLLAMHYVYRYVLLCNPSWLRWIGQSNPWRNWISLAIVADVLYIGGFMLAIQIGFLPSDSTRSSFNHITKEYYDIDLFAPNLPGYLGINYREPQTDGSYTWCMQSLIALGFVLLLFFGSGIVIVVCIWNVVAAMKQSEAMVATRTRNMQNQLFRALLIQTIVPTLTSYIPLGSVFVIPLTGISMGGWGTVSMMSTALFPVVDPLLVLFLVSGYRAKLPRFMRKLVTSTAQVSVVTPGSNPKSHASPKERSTLHN